MFLLIGAALAGSEARNREMDHLRDHLGILAPLSEARRGAMELRLGQLELDAADAGPHSVLLYADAASQCHAALGRLEPRSLEALVCAAEGDWGSGSLASALAGFQEAGALSGLTPAMQARIDFGLGGVRFDLGEFARAREVWARALTTAEGTRRVDVAFWLAWSEVVLDEGDAAAEHMRLATPIQEATRLPACDRTELVQLVASGSATRRDAIARLALCSEDAWTERAGALYRRLLATDPLADDAPKWQAFLATKSPPAIRLDELHRLFERYGPDAEWATRHDEKALAEAEALRQETLRRAAYVEWHGLRGPTRADAELGELAAAWYLRAYPATGQTEIIRQNRAETLEHRRKYALAWAAWLDVADHTTEGRRAHALQRAWFAASDLASSEPARDPAASGDAVGTWTQRQLDAMLAYVELQPLDFDTRGKLAGLLLTIGRPADAAPHVQALLGSAAGPRLSIDLLSEIVARGDWGALRILAPTLRASTSPQVLAALDVAEARARQQER